MSEHNVAVFTGSRAEYGLLRYLIMNIAGDPFFRLQLIVSGSHLSKNYGQTLNEILSDGIPIAARVSLSLDKIPLPPMYALTAEALEGVGAVLEQLKPKLLIVLGDRYEAFASAAAAHLLSIPVVHLHGGETTESVVDDRLRHAITQFSSWHFTVAEPYRRRVVAMGHSPSCVFKVAPLAMDGILQTPVLTHSEFESITGYRFSELNLLVTYHPVTLLADRGLLGFANLLQALSLIRCNILFTYPNADAGSDELLKLMNEFINLNTDRAYVVPSLGHHRYLSALLLFEAMAGNSSSGVIEAPLVGLPTLNIGSRQSGRLMPETVVNVSAQTNEILSGLETVLLQGRNSNRSRARSQHCSSPSMLIVKFLKSILDQGSTDRVILKPSSI